MNWMRWRAHPGILENGDAARIFRQGQDAAELAELGSFFPKSVEDRRVQGSDPEGSDVNLFDFLS